MLLFCPEQQITVITFKVLNVNDVTRNLFIHKFIQAAVNVKGKLCEKFSLSEINRVKNVCSNKHLPSYNDKGVESLERYEYVYSCLLQFFHLLQCLICVEFFFIRITFEKENC